MIDAYNITMFAYNEANNIEKSIQSVFDNVDDRLNTFYIIANGCKDNTTEIVNIKKEQLNFDKLKLIVLEIGDKCNAWNHYMHEVADDVSTHFFVDADVNFSDDCFVKMHGKLSESPECTEAIAGLPLSGRNIEFYRSLVIERSCFFGNLYGLKNSVITRIRERQFFLPIGLNWIDSFLTKAINTELKFFNYNLPNKTTYIEKVGYYFESLSPFRISDIKLYISRIARYELGKLQEIHLDRLDVTNWPKNMSHINRNIMDNFKYEGSNLSFFKRRIVKKRLKKLLRA